MRTFCTYFVFVNSFDRTGTGFLGNFKVFKFNKIISYLCEILDDLKMNFESHHDLYLPAGQCWHMIYTLNFYKKGKKTSQKKFDVNTRDPRRARWDFQGVLDDSIFLYLDFDMNKYLKNWGNYKVLWKFEGFIIIVIIIYLFIGIYGILRCAAMILCANLAFSCIDRFIPTVASLFWSVFVYIYIFYLFVVCRIY